MRCARARTLSRMVPLAYSSAFLAAVAPCERDATQCHPEPPLRRPERSEKGPHANEVDMASGLRTGDELARRSPEDQRDEGPSARKRSRYPAREALLSFAARPSGGDYREEFAGVPGPARPGISRFIPDSVGSNRLGNTPQIGTVASSNHDPHPVRELLVLVFDHDVDAPILAPPLRRIVGRDRMVFAISLGRERRRIDSLRVQMPHDIAGPRCGQFPVGREAVLQIAHDRQLVGVALNHDLLATQVLQRRHHLVEHIHSLGSDFPSAFLEKDLIDQGHLQAVFKLLDLNLVVLDLGFEALVQVLVGLIHVLKLLVLLDLLLVLLLRHASSEHRQSHERNRHSQVHVLLTKMSYGFGYWPTATFYQIEALAQVVFPLAFNDGNRIRLLR